MLKKLSTVILAITIGISLSWAGDAPFPIYQSSGNWVSETGLFVQILPMAIPGVTTKTNVYIAIRDSSGALVAETIVEHSSYDPHLSASMDDILGRRLSLMLKPVATGSSIGFTLLMHIKYLSEGGTSHSYLYRVMGG